MAAVPAGRVARAATCLHCGGEHRRVPRNKKVSGCPNVAVYAAEFRAAKPWRMLRGR